MDRRMWKGICGIKTILICLIDLCQTKENSTLILYLEVSEKAVNSVLVQDDDGEERSVYFVSKVLKGAEICYQKIERLTLAVLVTAMKIKQYF